MTEEIRVARRVSVVSRQMGVGKDKVHRLLDQGRLQGYRVGHLKYVYLDSVDQYQRDNQA
jgi:excisionase family DNA binding protein